MTFFQSIIEWFKNQKSISNILETPQQDFPGAILPTEAQLAEMPKFEEFVATANPVVWKQLDMTKLPKYPVYSQNGSSSCVAMSVALIASILYYIRTNITIMFSPAWIYQQRSNRPSQGMIGTEAFKIASKGLLPEVLMPSQDLTEGGIDSVAVYPWYKTVASSFAFEDTLVQLPTCDIETVASTIQTTGKPINTWFDFTRAEWTSIPVYLGTLTGLLRHSVVAITYGIWEGEHSIVIQESWGQGATAYGVYRIIKQSFFSKRNIFAAYPRRFLFDVTEDKPNYNGTIISFQRCMRSLGFFPIAVEFVESFGTQSRQACIKYQTAKGIPATGVIGDLTKAQLYKDFP